MASFQKRGKTWQYTVSNKGNPIRKGGFKTKREAQIAAAEVEAELRKGVVPNLKPVPFTEYMEKWIKTFKTDITQNTLERYKTSLKTVQEYFGDKAIQEIKKADYQEFLNIYGKTHAKASTRKLNTHIRACVKEAIDEGIIRIDFTRGAVLTGEPEKRPEEKHLNFEDSQKLLNALHERLDKSIVYYLLLLGLTSGMRFGEMVGLTRKDFDFKTNMISVTKQWGYTKKMGKGFVPTKTIQSIRKVKMDEKTMSVFKDLFDKTPENIAQLVFYSPTSKYKVISNGAANKALESILKELKIEPISVHGLRHTHASVLLYQKASYNYVAERLGHDVETLMKTYAHIMKEMRQQDEELSVNTFKRMYKAV